MRIDAEEPLLSASAAGSFAHLFRALSDPARLSIVHHLTLGDHRVRDLVDHLGLAQSTVSVHVARLRECGLVSTTSHGRCTVVALNEPETVALLLRAGEAFLRLTDYTARCRHLDPVVEVAG